MTADAAIAWLRVTRTERLERLREFLAIPTIGVDPGHHSDVRRAAAWLVAELRRIGQVERSRLYRFETQADAGGLVLGTA